jgi:hypothetical protein
MTALPLDSEYRGAIRVALVLQGALTLVLLLLLDGGQMAKIGGCAMIAFWMGTAMVMLRRPHGPSRADLLYIRWGYPAVLCVAVVIAVMIV